ncbi:sigma-70 family RNA polymerase sigma factor [Alkalihalobacillus oceani]|uniref:RNA polymerase sigma factor n=2 Tax=Halalkalibacter oceani TaxID=1653776 RepID=A0A9X2IPE7_9BACI|nr:sigma-70 family RNA polymerase sigma factor [Halalkalibacter oceani]
MGRQEAYSELYERTVQDVYKTVHFLSDNKTDVDDIVQDSFIQAFKALDKYDMERPFKPWLLGIAIKQVHAYRRKKWMRLRTIRRVEEQEIGKESLLYNQADERLANDDLFRSIEQLPFKLKQVVILHYLNDYSQEVVAGILDIPLGTVKSRVHAALKKLRQKEEIRQNDAKKVRNVQ